MCSADLNKEGTVAEQRAQAVGTVEAAVESLETRARAADSALTEALELGASGEQISYLVGRVQSLNDELSGVRRETYYHHKQRSSLPAP